MALKKKTPPNIKDEPPVEQQRPPKQQRQRKVPPPATFISFPDMKISFFMVEKNHPNVNIMIRFDDGKYKDLIVELSDFKFLDESKPSELSFNYDIIHNPYSKINYIYFNRSLKNIARKLIIISLDRARDMEVLSKDKNDGRTTNTKKSNS